MENNFDFEECILIKEFYDHYSSGNPSILNADVLKRSLFPEVADHIFKHWITKIEISDLIKLYYSKTSIDIEVLQEIVPYYLKHGKNILEKIQENEYKSQNESSNQQDQTTAIQGNLEDSNFKFALSKSRENSSLLELGFKKLGLLGYCFSGRGAYSDQMIAYENKNDKTRHYYFWTPKKGEWETKLNRIEDFDIFTIPADHDSFKDHILFPLIKFVDPKKDLMVYLTNPDETELSKLGYQKANEENSKVMLAKEDFSNSTPVYLYSTQDDIKVFKSLSEPDKDYKSEPKADGPAIKDELGRQPLIEDLDEIIGDVFKGDVQSNFTILINGEWGSGKSTIWNLLWHKLDIKGWKRIEYNAWEHQQLKNPWWILINRISQTASKENWEGDFHSHTWWSLKVKYRLKRVLLTTLVVVAFISSLIFWSTDNSLEQFSKILAIISTLIAFFAGMLTKFFISEIGHEEMKDRFPDHPYGKIRERFQSITKDNQVVIFIDDLDRCEPEPTVRLLESIQTLFKDSRVLYVIAADQKWLIKCFEEYYKVFGDLSTSGGSMGEKFVQKCFQLRVNMPKIEKKTFESFFYNQLGASAEEKKTPNENARENTPEPTVIPIVENTSQELAAGREQKKPESQAEKIFATKEKYLKEFVEAGLPNNPRLLKLFLNQYIVMMSILSIEIEQFSLDESNREKAVHFLIFAMRYPTLADQLKKGEITKAQLLGETTMGTGDKSDFKLNLTAKDQEEIKNLLQGIDEELIKGAFVSI